MVLYPSLLILAILSFSLAEQVPLAVDQIITPRLSKFVEAWRADENITGVALGLVRSNGYAEFGSWGLKDEDGGRMTADVRSI